MKLLDKLEWAYDTLESKLQFGLPEEIAIKRREVRVKQVLKEAVKEIKELEFQLDAFGGWLIEKKCPTSVLEEFRKARTTKTDK